MALTTMVKTMKVNKKPSVHGNGGTVLSVNAQDAWQKKPTIILLMVLLVGKSRTFDRPNILKAKLITGALIM